MTTALKTTIASLYATFAHYPLRSNVDGCPCCVSVEDQEKLSAKALNLLKSEDLSRYAWKAMSTWGNVADFKHFLPRLLELVATSGIAGGSSVVLRKLTYAKWGDWEPAEKDSVHSFLLAWWTELAPKRACTATDFTDLCLLFGEAEPLLKCWSIDFGDQSFQNLLRFIVTDYYNLIGKKAVFKELDPLAIDQILNWMLDKKAILEQGFYHFESIDPSLAKEISDALYMLDWVPIPDPKQG